MQGEQRRRAVALAAAALGALALLVLATAGSGGVDWGAPRIGSSWVSESAQDFGNSFDREQPPPEERAEEVEQASGAAWVVILVVGTLLAALVLRTLRPPRDDARRRDERGRPLPPDLDEGNDAVLAALRRAAKESSGRLAGAEHRQARDAVVAAWLALEQAAARGGTRRDPAQTPTEFTVALLRRHAADEAATAELLALYHRARFGSAPLPEDAAPRAAAALETIAADLAGARRG